MDNCELVVVECNIGREDEQEVDVAARTSLASCERTEDRSVNWDRVERCESLCKSIEDDRPDPYGVQDKWGEHMLPVQPVHIAAVGGLGEDEAVLDEPFDDEGVSLARAAFRQAGDLRDAQR